MPGRAPVSRWATLAAAVGLLAWLLASQLGGGDPQPPPPGLPDAGPWVAWGSRLAGVVVLGASVVTVGSLVVCLLVPAGDHADVRARAQRTTRLGAGAWCVVLLLGTALTRAEATGAPLGALRPTDVLAGQDGGATGVLVAQVAGLVVVARTAGRPLGCLVATLAVAAASVAGGHGASPDQTLAGAVVVHVVAALVWTGGLAGLTLHLRRDPAALAVTLPRFSPVALGCFVVLAGTGVVAALRTLGTSSSGWTGGYAAVLGAKVVLLVVAGGCGAAHRRWTIRAVREGRPRAYWRWASGELVVVATAAGLAAALARTPAPGAPLTSGPHGHVADAALQDGWSALWTAARPDPVVVLPLVLAGGWYVAAARRQGGSDHGQSRRTAAFVSGLATALLLTASGLHALAHVRPSALLVQLLGLLLVVPALLLAGRPWRLPGPVVPAAGWRSPPRRGALVVVGLVLVVQHTPAAAVALGSTWWHLALVALALAAGTVLWWPWLGPGGESEGLRERLGWSATVVLALAVLAVRVGPGGSLLAPRWFLELRLAGADPLADSRLASAVVAVAAAGYALAVLVLAVRTRQPGSRDPGGHTRATTSPVSSPAPIEP